ncbi:MAG: thioredoxin-disulfide reductase [Candidatus Bilamarchaeaceae archaeon]
MDKIKHTDILILGGGPAGLTAAIYASRAGHKATILEKGVVGGQIASTWLVENYPGIKSISGPELTAAMAEQAKSFGASIIEFAEVLSVDLSKKEVKTADSAYRAKAIIIATGNRERKLSVPGENEFKGRGVSYCATCDALFFKGKEIAVVGGGNSALAESLHLSKFASKITVIHRRGEFRAEKALQEEAFKNPKFTFLMDSVVAEIKGKSAVESIVVRSLKTGKETELKVSGVFVYTGMLPNSELFKSQLETDAAGFIITNEKMETSIPGVFAAGDVRNSSIKQITTAVSDGTVAAIFAGALCSQ